MDSTLRNLTVAGIALLLVQGSLLRRVHHDAYKQIAQTFQHTGSLQVKVQPSGWFGLEANRFSCVSIEGSGVVMNTFPLSVAPRRGWKGYIRQLHIDLTDFTLSGLDIHRFQTIIPSISYDLSSAMYKGSLEPRRAGIGNATVVILPHSLESFITKKYGKFLSNPRVELRNGSMIVDGYLNMFGISEKVRAKGNLVPIEGRYAELTVSKMELNGKELNIAQADALIQRINPLLDTKLDIGIDRFFYMTNITIQEDQLTISGDCTLPGSTETLFQKEELKR